MILESQAETKDGTRVRLNLTTLNLDTHSRIQELEPMHRMLLDKALHDCIRWAANFISENTVKKTA